MKITKRRQKDATKCSYFEKPIHFTHSRIFDILFRYTLLCLKVLKEMLQFVRERVCVCVRVSIIVLFLFILQNNSWSYCAYLNTLILILALCLRVVSGVQTISWEFT